MRWIGLGLVIALIAGLLVGCSTMLPVVKLDPAQAPPAPPSVLGAYGPDPEVTSIEDWETRRAPLLRRAFAEHVYGPYPQHVAPARLILSEPVGVPELDALAMVEQWSVGVGSEDRPLHFNMLVVLPRSDRPVPLVIMQTFCGNRAALRDPPDTVAGPLTPAFPACDDRWMFPLIEGVFGRYINGPPFEDLLERGYGVALYYAGDIVADEPEVARGNLAQLYGDEAENAGAIAAWAWLYSQAYDVLAADARVDAGRVAIWGHSRNGKSALLAGAMDRRFAAIISHQSGRGGASLNRSDAGEGATGMMEEYPHWFPPAYVRATDSHAMLDQHQLIALIAPRPLLLGNATRDAWADPLGAWVAAQAADQVYDLYGVEGLAGTDMRAPNHAGRIAFYARSGLHGVSTADWRVFLDFLDAHLDR
ncbi:MAG: alpha/beta hydrolase [Hyphomonadaceae bacterium]|nr:alpha/beta hydrolase [Hyphomonadaceae bacterium]